MLEITKALVDAAEAGEAPPDLRMLIRAELRQMMLQLMWLDLLGLVVEELEGLRDVYNLSTPPGP